MKAPSITAKRSSLVLAALMIAAPAIAAQPPGLDTIGVVIKLTYFGSGAITSSETTIDFKRTDESLPEIKCGTVVNTSFRIGAVGTSGIDDFVRQFKLLMTSDLHGTPIRLTVVCKINLPEIIQIGK